MKHIKYLLFFLGILFSIFETSAQVSQDTFDHQKEPFIKSLDQFIKLSNNPNAISAFDKFEKYYKTITEEALLQKIYQSFNLLKQKKFSAAPYFGDMLSVLGSAFPTCNSYQDKENLIDFLYYNIAKAEPKTGNKLLATLDFAENLYTKHALRYSQSSIGWYFVQNDIPDFIYTPFKGFYIKDMKIIGARGNDSITIDHCHATFNLDSNSLSVSSGKVSWERHDNKEIFADIYHAKIDLTKTEYTTDSAILHHPGYFKTQTISGVFTDKLITRNQAIEGSYPRFISKDDIITIEEIGGSVKYTGGFRLEGLNVVGFAHGLNLAKVEVFNKKNALTYRGFAKEFIIKKQQKITGNNVQSGIYIDNDSIVHPNLQFRYDIDKNAITLTRSINASDRSPFFSSYHHSDISADKITYYISKDTIYFGESAPGIAKGKLEVDYTSQNFFNENKYQKIQSIADYHPLVKIKQLSERIGTREIHIGELAREFNLKFEAENVQGLLYGLIEDGFLLYNPLTKMVTIKDKVFNWCDAEIKKRDYDNLNIHSSTNEHNGVFDIQKKELLIQGVQSIEFSNKQQVAIAPFEKQLWMYANRGMKFSGKLFAGLSTLIGKDYQFDYAKNSLKSDSIFQFDLFINSGKVNQNKKIEAYPLASHIEKFSGSITIDAPENKSGVNDIAIFPSLQTLSPSYVYYQYPFIFDNIYKKDSFYLKLDKFTFNSLDNYTRQDIAFKGNLISAKIFPEFSEKVLVQPDSSLGFTHTTPQEGYKIYSEKGNFAGTVLLSNKGLYGKGKFNYLTAETESQDILYWPKEMNCNAKKITIEEKMIDKVEYPKVEGIDVKVQWLPYKDSLYISTKETPFKFFNDPKYQCKGLLILTPFGLKARGIFDWPSGIIESNLMSFKTREVNSDTMNLKIRALNNSTELAFDTRNINGFVDFQKLYGKFRANSTELATKMPFNFYETSMNEFEWFMDKGKIEFKSDAGRLSLFRCTDPKQDSLQFSGQEASYDLNQNKLEVTGVPEIRSVDSRIIPGNQNVVVRKGGSMDSLLNSSIVLDTVNKTHRFDSAITKIYGRNSFLGSGNYVFYVPNIGEQKIRFEKVEGGKSEDKDEKYLTKGSATIKEEDNIFIHKYINFKGNIHVLSTKKEIDFEGYARINDKSALTKNWFSFSAPINKDKLIIPIQSPVNEKNDSIKSGVFLSTLTGNFYPTFLNVPKSYSDRELINVEGKLTFDPLKDRFLLGDSVWLLNPDARIGTYCIKPLEANTIYYGGKLNIGNELLYIDHKCAGTLTSPVVTVDSMGKANESTELLKGEIADQFTFPFPDELMQIIIADLNNNSLGVQPIAYDQDKFYELAFQKIIPDTNEYSKFQNILRTQAISLPKSFQKTTFTLGKQPVQYVKETQSFVNVSGKIPVIALKGNAISKVFEGYMEIRMPGTRDDRFYLYLRNPVSNNYYFMAYKSGILNITSSNPDFQEKALGLKEKLLVYPQEDGEAFEIQVVNSESADFFLDRIKELKQNK